MQKIKILFFYFIILTPIYAFEKAYFDSLVLKIKPDIHKFESSFNKQIDNGFPNFSCSPDDLKPFESDGCSLFPDGTSKNKNLWCECCFMHDIAYYQGGTEEERIKADEALRDCIITKTNDTNLANLVYQGVRNGGAWIYPTWYRWGYGWPYGRGYKALTEEEKKAVQEKLDEYLEGKKKYNCGK